MAGVVRTRPSFWADRSVLVTGHTGFKGSWLSLWLAEMGALVHGFALNPNNGPTVFGAARVAECLVSDTRADLSDWSALDSAVDAAEPEVVFHLAAQPLVSVGYHSPVNTWATNVQGSVHLLEAVRHRPSVRVVVVITSDKVYDNPEQGVPRVETDRLGGHDPYSSSKAAVELAVASYRRSYWSAGRRDDVSIATARAGNVIGGGDWGSERLVPDCLRAFEVGRPVNIRSPRSVRPWQHVLEPLSGYLVLAENLMDDPFPEVASSWNFGPDSSDEATVADVAEMVAEAWGPGAAVLHDHDAEQMHEVAILRLDSSRARDLLGWLPKWDLAEAVSRTVDWHRAWLASADLRELCVRQIIDYAGRT